MKLQPILGLPWPTLVLEVGNSEGIPKLVQNRNKYLGHETQINIFVGISYNRNLSRDDDSWWMCVAYRDVNAPQPPPGTPSEYPQPIVVGEFQKVNGTRWPNVKVPIAQDARVWSVPSYLLFHPQPQPATVPPLPNTFNIDVEMLRERILNHRLP